MIDIKEFTEYYSTHSDRFTKEYYNLTQKQLLQILSENNIQRHTKIENTKLSNLQLYGCTNVMSASKVKDHFKDLYGGSGSPFCKKEIRDKRDETVKTKYNVNNVFQIPEIKLQIKEVQTELYGGMGYNSTYQGDLFHKYLYDNVYFDSSWELIYYIYCKEHNMNINRLWNTIKFEYEYEGETYFYYPDFLCDGEYIEIKGDHFFRDGKMQNPFNHKEDGRYEAKHQCMLKNNVKILTYVDLENCFKYVKQKYGNN